MQLIYIYNREILRICHVVSSIVYRAKGQTTFIGRLRKVSAPARSGIPHFIVKVLRQKITFLFLFYKLM